jgi:hypothetical protein
MQPRQVRKRLARLEQWTNRAADFCRRKSAVRPEVRSEVARLDDEVELTARALQDEEDLGRMADKLDTLAHQGERAEDVVAGSTDEDIASPLRKAHKELVRLRRQLR